MNKNAKIILGVIGVIILIIICSAITPDEEKSMTSDENTASSATDILTRAQQQSNSVTEDEKKDFTSIDVATYLEKYKDSENHIVLIARTTCQYCQIAEPILHKIAKEYDLEIFYLDTDKVTDDEIAALVTSNEYFSNGFGTPILMIVGDEQIKDKVEGLTDYDNYVGFLKENHFIEGK